MRKRDASVQLLIVGRGLSAERTHLSPANTQLLHQRAHLTDVLQAEAGEPVAIYGEGKEHAMAIGITRMSTKDMREINKGHGVDVVHYLNDGLWKTQQFA